jgi:hypothetical protein
MQRRRFYLRLAAGLTAAAGLTSAADALTSNAFRYSAPRTGAYSINAAALSPDSNSLTYSNRSLASSLTSPGVGCFVTGLNLPDRASLTGLTVWYRKNSANSMVFYLYQNRLSSGSEQTILAREPATTSGDRSERSFPIPRGVTIANNANSYGFAVCFNSNNLAYFYGARITYKYTTAGD